MAFQPNLSTDNLELETYDTGDAGGAANGSRRERPVELTADDVERRAASLNDAAH